MQNEFIKLNRNELNEIKAGINKLGQKLCNNVLISASIKLKFIQFALISLIADKSIQLVAIC